MPTKNDLARLAEAAKMPFPLTLEVTPDRAAELWGVAVGEALLLTASSDAKIGYPILHALPHTRILRSTEPVAARSNVADQLEAAIPLSNARLVMVAAPLIDWLRSNSTEHLPALQRALAGSGFDYVAAAKALSQNALPELVAQLRVIYPEGRKAGRPTATSQVDREGFIRGLRWADWWGASRGEMKELLGVSGAALYQLLS